MDILVVVLIGVAVFFLDDRFDAGADHLAIEIAVSQRVNRLFVVDAEVDAGAEMFDSCDISADGFVRRRTGILGDLPNIGGRHLVELVKNFVLQGVISVERIAATVMSDVGKIGEAGKACGRQRQSGGYDGNEKRSATFYQ